MIAIAGLHNVAEAHALDQRRLCGGARRAPRAPHARGPGALRRQVMPGGRAASAPPGGGERHAAHSPPRVVNHSSWCAAQRGHATPAVKSHPRAGCAQAGHGAPPGSLRVTCFQRATACTIARLHKQQQAPSALCTSQHTQHTRAHIHDGSHRACPLRLSAAEDDPSIGLRVFLS